MCSKKLLKVLTTPSKIANALDWKQQIGGSIATIDVHAEKINMTISAHPEETSSSFSSSSSISSKSYSVPIHKKGLQKIPEASRQQLSDLVRTNNVCGFVVAWPIQQDTNLMGASCGRTLFAIEELLSSPRSSSLSSSLSSSNDTNDHNNTINETIFSRNRKLCLWDGNSNNDNGDNPDIFGRSSVYARTSEKNEHRASKEQYHEDETIVAAQIWDSFVETNWPDIYQQRNHLQQQQQQQQQQKQRSSDDYYQEEYHHQHQQRQQQQQQHQHGKKTLVAAAAA